MRWDELFDDLEAQLGAEQRRERDSEVADRTRRERASVSLAARFAASVGSPVAIRLVSGAPVRGELLDIGDGWLLVRLESGGEAVVPLQAVLSVSGLSARATGARTARRFTLGYALRGLSRDRAQVVVTDVAGTVLTGTIDAVGADFLDLAEHALGESRRPANVTGRLSVPFAAVALVASR